MIDLEHVVVACAQHARVLVALSANMKKVADAIEQVESVISWAAQAIAIAAQIAAVILTGSMTLALHRSSGHA